MKEIISPVLPADNDGDDGTRVQEMCITAPEKTSALNQVFRAQIIILKHQSRKFNFFPSGPAIMTT